MSRQRIGPPSIMIAGAGIFGVTAAIELRSRGWQVTLADPGPLPNPLAASTDISKVVRMDYGSDALYTELADQALAGWDTWNRRWVAEGKDALYHEDGFLLLSRQAMCAGGFEHESFELLRSRGYALERMDPALLARRYPAWNPARYPDGYFNPRAGWVESGRVLARLIEEARAAGVVLREGADISIDGVVVGDPEAPSRPREVIDIRRDALASTCGAEVLLVATGAWTPSVLPELGDVMWATAQPVMHFAPADPVPFRAPAFPVWAADISNTGWYGFPANAAGIVKVANHGPGRRIHPEAPRLVEPGDEPRFREFLRESIPGLAAAPLAGSRLCLYCDTYDGDFWIARHPDARALIVAAGDCGHALKFAPVLGALIADVVEGEPNPFASRFAWRGRGKASKEEARHN